VAAKFIPTDLFALPTFPGGGGGVLPPPNEASGSKTRSRPLFLLVLPLHWPTQRCSHGATAAPLQRKELLQPPRSPGPRRYLHLAVAELPPFQQ
jgi:hypothetical protein